MLFPSSGSVNGRPRSHRPLVDKPGASLDASAMKRLLLSLLLPLAPSAGGATAVPPAATFEVRFARTVRAEPAPGRVFVAVTRDGDPEPRLQVGDLTGAPFFGVDVTGLRPGDP